MIADAGLGDRFAEALFQEDGVGHGLDAVAGPGLGTAVVVAAAAAALVLDGHPQAVAAAHGVDLAEESPALAGDVQGALFRRLVVRRGDLDVQPPAGIHGGVGDADFLDLFKIEKPLAVKQSVQGHDPQRRLGKQLSRATRFTASLATVRFRMVGLDRLVFLWRLLQHVNRTGI